MNLRTFQKDAIKLAKYFWENELDDLLVIIDHTKVQGTVVTRKKEELIQRYSFYGHQIIRTYATIELLSELNLLDKEVLKYRSDDVFGNLIGGNNVDMKCPVVGCYISFDQLTLNRLQGDITDLIIYKDNLMLKRDENSLCRYKNLSLGIEGGIYYHGEQIEKLNPKSNKFRFLQYLIEFTNLKNLKGKAISEDLILDKGVTGSLIGYKDRINQMFHSKSCPYYIETELSNDKNIRFYKLLPI